MKMLVVCHRFPYPPKRGGKIRPFNIIRHLSRSHEVTVASIVRSEQEAEEGVAEEIGKLAGLTASYRPKRQCEPSKTQEQLSAAVAGVTVCVFGALALRPSPRPNLRPNQPKKGLAEPNNSQE